MGNIPITKQMLDSTIDEFEDTYSWICNEACFNPHDGIELIRTLSHTLFRPCKYNNSVVLVGGLWLSSLLEKYNMKVVYTDIGQLLEMRHKYIGQLEEVPVSMKNKSSSMITKLVQTIFPHRMENDGLNRTEVCSYVYPKVVNEEIKCTLIVVNGVVGYNDPGDKLLQHISIPKLMGIRGPCIIVCGYYHFTNMAQCNLVGIGTSSMRYGIVRNITPVDNVIQFLYNVRCNLLTAYGLVDMQRNLVTNSPEASNKLRLLSCA
jgi:hypothetical protein